MNVFTFEQFEAHFFNQSYSKDVFTAFEKRIKELQENEQILTAQTYQDLTLIQSIHPKEATTL